MAITPSKEVLRNLNNGIRNWLETLLVNYGTIFGPTELRNVPIIAVSSSPDRAFAQAVIQAVERGWLPEADNNSVPENNADNPPGTENDRQIYPMPLARFQITDIQPTTDQHVPMSIDVTQGMSGKKYAMPTPYEASIVIEFVSDKRFTMDHCDQWFMSQFTPTGAGVNTRYIDVLYPFPWGNVVAQIRLGSRTDNSDLEQSDPSRRRVIRSTWSVTARFWNVDLVGSSPKKAILDVATAVYLDPLVDIPLGVHGPNEAAPRQSYSQILSVDNPHPKFFAPFTSAVKSGSPQTSCWVLGSSSDHIDVCHLPVPSGELLEGCLWVRATDADDASIPPGPLQASVAWVDVLAGTTLLVQNFQGPLKFPPRRPTLFTFSTRTGLDTTEASLRLSRPTGSTQKIRVIVDRIEFRRNSFPEILSAPQQVLTLSSFTQTVQYTGLTPRAAYALRARTPNGASDAASFALDVYTDAGLTQTAGPGSANTGSRKELVSLVSPGDSGTLYAKYTTNAAGLSSVLNNISLRRSCWASFQNLA